MDTISLAGPLEAKLRAIKGAGLVPEAAAQSIIGTCRVELFDVAKIVREGARAGSVAIPLVKILKETVSLFNPQAAPSVHWGSTSQDVIDTAMALVTRDALALIRTDVNRIITVLLGLAGRYCDTPMLGRTLMAQDLSLRTPVASWHAQRDEWVALGCELGLLAGSLGKIAKDIALMSQFEVAEVAEPVETGRGGRPACRTSTMPWPPWWRCWPRCRRSMSARSAPGRPSWLSTAATTRFSTPSCCG